ncbi:MAG TPA: hypothetical protein PLY36_13235 [Spirochaetota bacterium]|nr:hypothetical protein [Spirochaetota bacterium]
MLPEDISNKIKFEIGEIDREFLSYKLLFDLIKLRTPDLVEMTAMASVLHSFYNGVENIFLLIAKKVDKKIPSGMKWHNELLKQMTLKTEIRKEVIDEEVFEILKDYLLFRHFIRHSYKWRLNWDEFKDIALNAENNWNRIKELLLENIFG